MFITALKKMALALALLGAVGVAWADASSCPPDSFCTPEGSSFTNVFLLTHNGNEGLDLTLSGSTKDYSSLSFEIMSGSGVITNVVATIVGGKLTADYDHNLASGAYTLTVTGFTKINNDKNTIGAYKIEIDHGSIKMVSSVPEPESYAMLLAGLGLVGTIARRRTRASVT